MRWVDLLWVYICECLKVFRWVLQIGCYLQTCNLPALISRTHTQCEIQLYAVEDRHSCRKQALVLHLKDSSFSGEHPWEITGPYSKRHLEQKEPLPDRLSCCCLETWCLNKSSPVVALRRTTDHTVDRGLRDLPTQSELWIPYSVSSTS